MLRSVVALARAKRTMTVRTRVVTIGLAVAVFLGVFIALAHAQQSGVIRDDDCLPPQGAEYVGQFLAAYADGQGGWVQISSPILAGFTDCFPPPRHGRSTTHTFGCTVQANVLRADGTSFTMLAPAVVTVKVTFRDGGKTRIFDAEMTQLDVSDGTLPAGMMIRESPTRSSTGITNVTGQPGGKFRITSFFDVFTELSRDGGQTWFPSETGSGYTELTDLP